MFDSFSDSLLSALNTSIQWIFLLSAILTAFIEFRKHFFGNEKDSKTWVKWQKWITIVSISLIVLGAIGTLLITPEIGSRANRQIAEHEKAIADANRQMAQDVEERKADKARITTLEQKTRKPSTAEALFSLFDRTDANFRKAIASGTFTYHAFFANPSLED